MVQKKIVSKTNHKIEEFDLKTDIITPTDIRKSGSNEKPSQNPNTQKNPIKVTVGFNPKSNGKK